MEEKLMKEFDRSIERMMNESAVTPPFGMWNRISSELDVVAPAAPVATPLVPRGVLYGFIAGASLAGTLIAAMLLVNETRSNKEVASVTPSAVVTPPSIINNTPATVTENEAISTPETKPTTLVATTKTIVVQVPVVEYLYVGTNNEQKVLNDYEQDNVEPENTDNNINITTMNFEVDENAYQLRAKQLETSLIPTVTAAIDNDKEDEEKKSKAVTSYSEKKIKYKKRKSARFSYGKINRLKKNK